jgi:hypothetical protein
MRLLGLILYIFAAAAEIEKEDGILTLTDSNFDQAISTHQTGLLVQFYNNAPWW